MDLAILAGFLDRVVASGLVRPESDQNDDGSSSSTCSFRRSIRVAPAPESENHPGAGGPWLNARIDAGSNIPVEEVARHYQAAGLLKESVEQFQFGG